MEIVSNPLIQKLAALDPELIQLFSPTERAVIETCKEIIEKQNNGKISGNECDALYFLNLLRT